MSMRSLRNSMWMRRSFSPRPASTPSAPPNASSITSSFAGSTVRSPNSIRSTSTIGHFLRARHATQQNRCAPRRPGVRAARRLRVVTAERSRRCRARAEGSLAVDVDRRPHAADAIAQRRRDVAWLRRRDDDLLACGAPRAPTGGGVCAQAHGRSAHSAASHVLPRQTPFQGHLARSSTPKAEL